MTWEKQESNSDFWNPEKENEELVGEVIEVRPGMYGNQYLIKKENGEEILTPSHKILQGRMTKVIVGNKVKHVFIKQDLPKIKGQNGVKLYDVFIDLVVEEKVA